jgi:NADP-dependent 3-hydroxy acid dehydrogenase YdfG
VAQAIVAAGGNAMLVGRNADKLAAVVKDIEAHAGEASGSGAIRARAHKELLASADL